MIIEKQWHQVKNVLQAKLDSTFSVAPDATTEFDSLLALTRSTRSAMCAISRT